MALTIASAELAAMIAHAATEAPNEACGLLLGSDHHIERVQSVANVADDPARRFEVDPAALFAALRAERAGGPRLIGHYHSHPNGLARPSATDAAMIRHHGEIWLIVAGDGVTAWQATATNGFVRLSLAPIDSPGLSGG